MRYVAERHVASFLPHTARRRTHGGAMATTVANKSPLPLTDPRDAVPHATVLYTDVVW